MTQNGAKRWPAPGSEDTELGVLKNLPANAGRCRYKTRKPLISLAPGLTLNQRVLGSSPSAPTNPFKGSVSEWGNLRHARVCLRFFRPTP